MGGSNWSNLVVAPIAHLVDATSACLLHRLNCSFRLDRSPVATPIRSLSSCCKSMLHILLQSHLTRYQWSSPSRDWCLLENRQFEQLLCKSIALVRPVFLKQLARWCQGPSPIRNRCLLIVSIVRAFVKPSANILALGTQSTCNSPLLIISRM